MRVNQEMIKLFSKNKVNPMSGCLPMLVQIPVFFALYKVLFVAIDMRHAPFFGWIRDLSAPDPINIFSIFDLIHLNLSSILSVGLWPFILSMTMILQSRFNRGMHDANQEVVMKILPYVFMFMFSSFAVGLVVYWTWSNILSMLQQYFINRKYAR